jgi:hypothetical protein
MCLLSLLVLQPGMVQAGGKEEIGATGSNQAGHGEGPFGEAGAAPDDGLGAGRAARQRQRAVSARRDRPEQLLRLKAALPATGLDGLKDLPPVAKSHPMTTPAEVVARILELALQHLGLRLQPLLALEGRRCPRSPSRRS